MKPAIQPARNLAVRVHSVEMLLREGETCREVSSSANHFDVTGRFGGTCFCQRVIELAERRYLGGEPILATQGGWQQMVVPGGQVVVFPVRIFFDARSTM